MFRKMTHSVASTTPESAHGVEGGGGGDGQSQLEYRGRTPGESSLHFSDAVVLSTAAPSINTGSACATYKYTPFAATRPYESMVHDTDEGTASDASIVLAYTNGCVGTQSGADQPEDASSQFPYTNVRSGVGERKSAIVKELISAPSTTITPTPHSVFVTSNVVTLVLEPIKRHCSTERTYERFVGMRENSGPLLL